MSLEDAAKAERESALAEAATLSEEEIAQAIECCEPFTKAEVISTVRAVLRAAGQTQARELRAHDLLALLPERLRDYAETGPIQRAVLIDYARAVLRAAGSSDEDRKDAERYRALRDSGAYVAGRYGSCPWGLAMSRQTSKHELDAAADMAVLRAAGGKG